MKQRKDEETEEETEIEETEEEETKEAPKKKKEEWEVRLVIVEEDKIPQKVLINTITGETLDMYGAVARLLNDNKKLKEGILG